MKKTVLVILTTIITVTLGAASAMAHSGGGGGGGGGDGGLDTSGSTVPPSVFEPLDLGVDDVYVMPGTPESVEPTEVLVLDDRVSPEEMDALVTIAVLGGGILIGYSTGGYVIYVAAGAGGTYSVATTHMQNIGKPESERTSLIYVGVKDTAIGLVPVSPPAQAAISMGVDEVKNVIMEAPAINNPSPGPGGFAPTYSR